MKINKREQEILIKEHYQAFYDNIGIYKEKNEERDYWEKRETSLAVQEIFDEVKEYLDDATYDNKPSQILQEKKPEIIKSLVPIEKQEEVLCYIDKINKFSYYRGWRGCIVRTGKRWCFSERKLIERLLPGYFHLTFYGKNLVDYYNNTEYRLALEEEFGKENIPRLLACGDMIAAELDMGNTKLAQVLEDILLSNNNTNIVTRDIILGIVRSDNTHLHKVLGDFLLAAQLQEGVRQTICELMVRGTTEAFMTLLQVINDNNMIRFSTVRRAICSWTGICSEEYIGQITEKQVNIVIKALLDEGVRKELLNSNDTVELYIGLWAHGFFEVEHEIFECERIARNGNRNQKLLLAYYNFISDRQEYASKFANEMIESNPQDIELCAVLLFTYMTNVSMVFNEALYGNKTSYYNRYSNSDFVYQSVPCTVFFENENQARLHFDILKNIKDCLPKKGKEYSPCIFPWYSIKITHNDLASRLVMIAYMLQDDTLIDTVCTMFADMEVRERSKSLRLLLHAPKTKVQKETLIKALVDKTSDTRMEAYDIIQEIALVKEDYETICSFMKYKSLDIRRNILNLLEKQGDEELKETIKTLLADRKEEVRLGGLDLVVRLKKDENRKALFAACISLVKQIDNSSDKENVIIAELIGDSQAEEVLLDKGYGLYNPDAKFMMPDIQIDVKFFSSLFTMSQAELYGVLRKLDVLYTENENAEYKSSYGMNCLLKNDYRTIAYEGNPPKIERYPFAQLWVQFYHDEIKDFKNLLQLVAFLDLCDRSNAYGCCQEWFEELAEMLYGKQFLNGDLNQFKHSYRWKNVLYNLYETYFEEEENKRLMKDAAWSMFMVMLSLPRELSEHVEPVKGEGWNRITRACENRWFVRFKQCAMFWENNEDFKQMFWLCIKINEFYGERVLDIHYLYYIKAYVMNEISKDNLLQIALGPYDSMKGLSSALREMALAILYPNVCYRNGVDRLYESDGDFEHNSVMQTAIEIYWQMVDMILKVELKRSEVPTVFSPSITSIARVRGVKCLVDILVALGNDILEPSPYYSGFDGQEEKRVCLSHLITVCVPLPEEDGNTLRECINGMKISEKRLVEVAVYNTIWADCIEEYLGWKGLKSGIYYFTAHTSKQLSDKTMAMIAKYTPLSAEELNEGAFDLLWFKECIGLLGEKNFQVLYKCAKYVSSSNKHTRACKYADAAMGRVTAEELEAAICDKRNNDLLMSYALLPITDDQVLLARYQFIQKYLKESKQFGAKRRESETVAVSRAMQNLAASSGYLDVTRLSLNMETKLVESLKEDFEWQVVEDVQVKIAVEEDGKPVLVCVKDGKELKSIPAKLKKNEVVVHLKEVHDQLKEQHSRTRIMFEQFMEDGVTFTVEEIRRLQKNPIVLPIIKNLVYISGEYTGFLTQDGLISAHKEQYMLDASDELRVAHPYDLWELNVWQDYQKELFGAQKKQAFKQVFRELYVKTMEESECFESPRYEGNQIQPCKAKACLKGRRWVADYENGLQKVYYKENIVARIFAPADWLSVRDTQVSVLKYVEFLNRKTFSPIKIADIPARIFSEVMRDVDLAVSVAHVGGVDPETSHSTIEMRKAIVEFNLPMFGLTNVSIVGNHVLIEGKRANYTIHLGSGVIFKQGGTQIAVLPVYSQYQGRLFLPFVDEDPKTAEIMSKIILFAEDMKIRDPYILEQIM